MGPQRFLVQFAGGVVAAGVGYLLVVAGGLVLEGLSINYGRTSIVVLAFLVGYPLGSTAGVALADTWLLQARRFRTLHLSLAFGFAVLAGLTAVAILFLYEKLMLLPTLGLTACLATLGYNLPNLLERRGSGPAGPRA